MTRPEHSCLANERFCVVLLPRGETLARFLSLREALAFMRTYNEACGKTTAAIAAQPERRAA